MNNCIIKLTKNQVAIVDREYYDWLNLYKWHCSCSGDKMYYAARRFFYDDGSGASKIVMMHNIIIGSIPGILYVDHINGDTLDNRINNLRHCTMKQNNHNLSSHKDSVSKYKGVCWSGEKNKWRANICINRKQTHLGYFSNEVDAAIAYNNAAIIYYGRFAKINVIGD